ncbi:hypothetical protein [Nocardia bhagyanarayanae]|uniref:hypothetical protein n=1 Tax=Nocardia bhagyanarayanae TaxID=1215925 RepID=UPI001C89E31F|nr:hypothetical protein [Nocardia bhagyanarayanae]
MSVYPSPGTLTGVSVHFDRASRTETGQKPAAANQFVFLFDRSIRPNPHRFPSCSRAVLATNGVAACPAGSKVGTGVADFYPEGRVQVVVFNTVHPSGESGVLITIPATGAILENTFEPVADAYRGEYGWGSDELLPSPLPPDQRGATVRFQVSFGATYTDEHGTHSYLESFALPGQQLRFGLWSRFVTGQTILPTATAPRPLPVL